MKISSKRKNCSTKLWEMMISLWLSREILTEEAQRRLIFCFIMVSKFNAVSRDVSSQVVRSRELLLLELSSGSPKSWSSMRQPQLLMRNRSARSKLHSIMWWKTGLQSLLLIDWVQYNYVIELLRLKMVKQLLLNLSKNSAIKLLFEI